MKIPTKSDWGFIDEDDIERRYAFDMFIGKSPEDAWVICLTNADNYQEELQSMPKVPFNFYAPILCRYIISESAKEDSDGASCFLDMVAWMLKTQASIIESTTKEMLVSSAKFVSENQRTYDASFDIYGNFKDKYIEIRKCTFGSDAFSTRPFERR